MPDFPPMTWQTVLAIVAMVAAMTWSWREPRRVAVFLGFLLPIDYVTGITPGVFDTARYLAVAWLIIRAPVTISDEVRRRVLVLAGAIAVVALTRGVFAVARLDKNSMVFAGVMLLSTVCAALIALRTQVHRALVVGYLGGLTVSAATSIMQALHLPAIRAGNLEGHRYPGVATLTMLLTWQLAFGILVAIYLLATRRRGTGAWILGLLLLPIFSAAILTNGAQGGLLGLVAAGFALVYARPPGLRLILRRALVGGVALAAVLVLVAVLSSIDLPTIGGLAGDDGYRNERARWDISVNGLREIRRHPVTGMGRTEFMDRYTIAPHFLPVDTGVVAGVLGLVLATGLLLYVVSLVLGGPADKDPLTILGFCVLAAVASDTLIESNGPFTGLSRVTVLFIAYVAACGEHTVPEPRPEVALPATTAAPST